MYCFLALLMLWDMLLLMVVAKPDVDTHPVDSDLHRFRLNCRYISCHIDHFRQALVHLHFQQRCHTLLLIRKVKIIAELKTDIYSIRQRIQCRL